jgi:hypothetical protein
MPPAMVEPERETPGKSEITCQICQIEPRLPESREMELCEVHTEDYFKRRERLRRIVKHRTEQLDLACKELSEFTPEYYAKGEIEWLLR